MRRLNLRRRAWLLGGVGVVALAGAAIAGAAVLTAGTPVQVAGQSAGGHCGVRAAGRAADGGGQHQLRGLRGGAVRRC